MAKGVTLGAFTTGLRALVGLDAGESEQPCERRGGSRYDFCGHKVIVRQRKALGILHLKDVSKNGASGLTDMPLAVGSIVFLGLERPYFFAAEVLWTKRLTIGLKWLRPLPMERLEKLHAAHLVQKAARERHAEAGTSPARRGGRQTRSKRLYSAA